MKRLLAAIVLLWSCATVRPRAARPAPPPCVTPCGMVALDGDCESLQRYEGRVLRRLARGVSEYREQRMCRALRGWTLKLHAHDPLLDKGCGETSWLLFEGFCAAGLTTPWTRTIELGELDWMHSPLAHEIAHVADLDLGVATGHCRWGDQGLLRALADVSSRVETSAPEADCAKP